jgi:ATP-dependent Clp protease ATP-binding subunit ClpA
MLVGVFERFTDRARRVLVLAQEEARLLKHNFIGTEHILLGLMHEGEGKAAKALESLGISLEAVRAKVEETVGPIGSPREENVPFTPRAKKALELSLREALQLGHQYIGTEHLLLGLLREGEGVAVQVLVALGPDPARIRQEVMTVLSGALPSESTQTWHVGVSSSEMSWSAAEPHGGPRCPSCRAVLEETVRYRILAVPPVEEDAGLEPINVVVVYCLRCGVTVAHTPAAAT